MASFPPDSSQQIRVTDRHTTYKHRAGGLLAVFREVGRILGLDLQQRETGLVRLRCKARRCGRIKLTTGYPCKRSLHTLRADQRPQILGVLRQYLPRHIQDLPAHTARLVVPAKGCECPNQIASRAGVVTIDSDIAMATRAKFERNARGFACIPRSRLAIAEELLPRCERTHDGYIREASLDGRTLPVGDRA